MNKSPGNKKGNAKRKWFLLCIILVILLAVIVAGIHLDSQFKNSIVAYVNSEPIVLREFKVALSESRSYAYSYFREKYNLEDSKDFWTIKCSGEMPIEIAKKKALDECIGNRIFLMLAKEKGLIEDISYEGFLQTLEKENTRRKKALEKGQVIYGPTQYGEKKYYSYILSNLRVKLEEKMGESQFQTNEKEARDYYDSMKDKIFMLEDWIRIQVISVSYKEDSGDKTVEEKKKKAKVLIGKAKAGIDDGVAFEELARRYNSDGMSNERIFESSTTRTSTRANPVMKSEASELEPGHVSGVFEENFSFNIIKCMERRPGGYRPFDEVKDTIKIQLDAYKMEELLEKLAEEASIEINEKVYNRIKMN